MKRKWLAVGIILLFVGTALIPSSGQKIERLSLPMSRGNTLYVGGSGPGNYTKIQDAIDNASNGDTVFVYDDSSPYHENIIIDKSLSLIGENRDTTVLWGNNQNDTIILTADNTIISRMTIQQDAFMGLGNIQIDGDNNKIIDNKFISGYGISFYDKGQNSIVENNLFFSYRSIYAWGTKEIIIRNNTMDNSEWCITLYSSSFCTIENNSMFGGGLSVVEVQGESNKIINNTIRWNDSFYVSTHTGLELSGHPSIVRDNHLIKCGIMLAYHPRGEISNNFVNGKPFVYLHDKQDIIVDNAGQVYLEDCENVTVRNLTISNVNVGIRLFYVDNSLIEDNTLSDCLECINGYCNNSVFMNNSFDSCESGMNILGHSNYIIKNRFSNCSLYGIDANVAEDVQNNSFTFCGIGLELASGFCSYNKIDNCSTGIQCSGDRPIRIIYNSIQFCGTGIFAGGFGFKSLKVTDMSTTMVLPIPWHFQREISYNNIMNTSNGASFANSLFTHWISNYWGEPYKKLKIIHGYFLFNPYYGFYYPWINIDWHPAKKPYDIPEMR